MATIDEILNTGQKGGSNKPTVATATTQQPIKQQTLAGNTVVPRQQQTVMPVIPKDGTNVIPEKIKAPTLAVKPAITTNNNATTAQNTGQTANTETNTATTEPKRLSYVDMYKQLNPYRPPTAEELEKEKKKQEREQMYSAISDGISALSNLYFTTKDAPNMYDAKNNLSERTQARWDKLKKEREANRDAYNNAILRMQKIDDDNDFRNRNFLYKQIQDAVEAEQKEKDAEYKAKRDNVKDRQWEKQYEHKIKTDDDRIKLGKENNEIKKANNEIAKARLNISRQALNARTAGKKSNKKIGFISNNGKKVYVNENVWKGSMQQVYDILQKDLGIQRAYLLDRTPAQKEDFVKQNWHKSPTATNLMLQLAKEEDNNIASSIEEEEQGNADVTPKSAWFFK